MSIISDLNRDQMVIPFGTGASYDYVDFSAMTMDVDSWKLQDDTIDALLIKNDRLLNYVNYLLRTTYEGSEKFKKIRGIIQMPIRYDERSSQEERLTMNSIEVNIFPKWGVCSRCSALAKFSGTNSKCINDHTPKWLNQSCKQKNKDGFKIEPARFISYCHRGHIQDFPWEEYMSTNCLDSCILPKGQANHTPNNPSLYLSDDSNGNGFASLKLTCRHCKKERTLSGVNKSGVRENSLDRYKNKILKCKGEKPWTTANPENCNLILDVQPRGAAKIYQSIMRSGIYIPEEGIGIRLEDDVVVQKNSEPKNLMENIPIEAEEIEDLMN